MLSLHRFQSTSTEHEHKSQLHHRRFSALINVEKNYDLILNRIFFLHYFTLKTKRKMFASYEYIFATNSLSANSEILKL